MTLALRWGMDTSLDQHGVLADLQGLVPLAPINPDIVLRIFGVVRIPNAESALPALEAIARLGAGIRWATSLAWPVWPTLDEVNGQLGALLPYVGKFHTQRKPKLTRLQDAYPVYSALIDSRPYPPAWLEEVRAILLACACQWVPQGEKAVALDTLSSAIRGLRRNPDLLKVFSKFDSGGNLQALVEQARKANVSSSKLLSGVWLEHVIPALEDVSSSKGAADGAAEPPQSPPGPIVQKGVLGTGKEPRRKTNPRPKSLPPLRTIRAIPNPQVRSEHERAEAPEDIAGAGVIADVPLRARHFTGKRVALYKATQAIWSQNHLLATEHYESLGAAEAEELGRYLIREGNQRLRTNAASVRPLAWLMLSLATGRGPQPLASLQVSVKGAKRQASSPWVLDVAHGQIHQPVLRPDQAFVPDKSESTWLETPVDEMTLVLTPVIAEFLRDMEAAGIQLGGQTPEEIRICLRDACAEAREALQLRIFPGRARRALACLLQDAGRDLVATMMITGDTHGLSTAPLYYTAPREVDLQRLYARVTASVFGGDTASAIATEGRRLGARLLVKSELRREFSGRLGSKLHAKRTGKRDIDSVVLTHNALADHVAGMFLDGAAHRPVENLFSIARGDLDLRGHIALFQDKNVDLAHETRFAAMPEVLCTQITVYLEHLRAIEKLVPQSERRKVRDAYTGKAPLLFELGEQGGVRAMTLTSWLARTPEAWRKLPPNFGRTTVATRGRDLGASPEALATQLGHLEAVGFPFSEDSPTEPVLLAADLAPVLEQLARQGGWKVRSGYRSSASEVVWLELGPLRNWEPIVDAHEAKAKAAERAASAAKRAAIRANRIVGEQWAIEAIAETAPRIAEALRAKPAETESAGLELLDADEVLAIQEALRIKAAGDLVATMASLSALTRLLARLGKQHGWAGYVPYEWRSFRGAQSSPFFPGMMVAREQIEVLREDFCEIPRHPPDGVSARSWDFARAALAICLFGFVDDPEQVAGLLAARGHTRRSAALPDLTLVSWRNEPRAVAGLRGLAAIALCNLARKYPDPHEMPEGELDLALRRMLPVEACGAGRVLQRLCATVGVCNRIELSGAARLATGVGGCVPAEADRQIAWLDGDPVTPSEASGASYDDEDLSVEAPDVPARRGGARAEYLKMLKWFPSERANTVLPRTGVRIEPTQIESSRNLVIAEFEAYVASGSGNNVVVAIAHWVLKMLREGTLAETNPAYSTIRSYVSLVGGPLVELADQSRLTDFDEPELAQIYVDVVEMRRAGKDRAAREVMHFHDVVAPIYGLPELDYSEYEIYLGKGATKVDAELIIPQELQQAVQIAKDNDGRSVDTVGRRTCRQSALLLRMTGAAGCRSGEPLGMQLRDACFSDRAVVVAFVPNRHRRIKTRAGVRVVDITHRLSDVERADLAAWVDAEKGRLPSAGARHGYLYAGRSSGSDLSVKQVVRGAAIRSIRSVTKRKRERLHRIRHMVAGEGLMWATLPDSDRERIGFLKPLASRALPRGATLFPRDLHRHTLVIGHRRPATSIRIYMHMGWALRARADQWMQYRVTRWTAAAAMGVSVFRADQIRQQNREVPQSQAWLDVSLGPRHMPSISVASPESVAGTDSEAATLSAAEVGLLLGWTERNLAIDAAGLVLGATARQARLVAEAVAEYTARIGRDFVSRSNGSRTTRRVSSAQHLYGLWDIDGRAADDPLHKKLGAVVAAVFTWAKPTDQDAIVLPASEANMLVELLEAVGHARGLASMEAHETASLRIVRVARQPASGNAVAEGQQDAVRQPGKTGAAKRYAGRELKRILGVIWVRHRIAGLEAFDRA